MASYCYHLSIYTEFRRIRNVTIPLLNCVSEGVCPPGREGNMLFVSMLILKDRSSFEVAFHLRSILVLQCVGSVTSSEY